MTTYVPIMNLKSTFFVNTTSKQAIDVFSFGIDGQALKPDVILSTFNFKNPSKIKPRKSPKKRCLPASSGSIDKDSFLEEEFESNN